MKRIIVITILIFLITGLLGKSYRMQNLYNGSYDNPARIFSNSYWVSLTDMSTLHCWEWQDTGQLKPILETTLPENVWGVQAVVAVPDTSVDMPGIWLTSSNGVLKYLVNKWNRWEEITADQMIAGDSSDLWLIANGTLMRYNGAFKQVVSDIEWQTQAFGASCMQIDRHGFPWIGVMGPSIVRFNGTNLDDNLACPSGPPSDEPGQDDVAPHNICFDADNNPWVDYPKGVACWKNGAWVEHDLTRYGFEWGASQLVADNSGIIWAGDGGRHVVCFDGDKWYEPEILGGNLPNDNWWIAQMIPGPGDMMLFLLASESPAFIKAYVCQPEQERPAELKVEINKPVQRNYPPPVPDFPSSREKQGFKGPVKTVFSQQISLPTYFSYEEYYPDGKLKLRRSGRTSMNGETTYWYDDHGNVIKEQHIEYGNGEEFENDQIVYEYEYDPIGYPLRKTSKTAAGEVYRVEVYTYSETGYVKEWETEPNDYSPGFTERESYDIQGRIISWISTNMADGSVDKREYSYLPDTNQKYELDEWNGSGFNRKRVVTLTPLGQEGNWILYDGTGKILAKYTQILNAHGDSVSSVYVDMSTNSTSRTTSKYTYDSYGNHLRVESTVDGQPDDQGSNTFTYEYY